MLNGRVPVNMCALLWAHHGAEADLVAYEDEVLELLPDHGARLISRARTAGLDGEPYEIQLIEFPSEDALADYVADERRMAMADQREAAVSRTELMRVDFI